MFTRKIVLKTLGLLIAVAVLLALLPGEKVMAEFSPDFYFHTTGNGTAEWVDYAPGFGDHSVKLSWTGSESSTNVVFTVPDDLKVKDLDSWDYWFKTPTMEGVSNPTSYAPTISFYLDTELENDEGKDYDTRVIIWPESPHVILDTWVNFQSTTSLSYKIWRGGA